MVQNIALVIESSADAELWGRIHYDDNLIIESAPDLKILDRRMKKLLKDFHQLNPKDIAFDIQYDITGLFNEKKFLKASIVADRAGISRGLMRQYISGSKYPSQDRVLVIQKTIHSLGKELQQIKVAPPVKKRTVKQ
jgi:hypothetical protein